MLSEVLEELRRQNDAKRDFIAPAQALRLSEDGSTFVMDHIGPKDSEIMGTTDLFHRQIGAALNIPAKYYDMMKTRKPELLARNVNTWLAEKNQSYMIRSMDSGTGRKARAFLSDRYRRIDNMEIASSFCGKRRDGSGQLRSDGKSDVH